MALRNFRHAIIISNDTLKDFLYLYVRFPCHGVGYIKFVLGL